MTPAEYEAGLARLDAIWDDPDAGDEVDALVAELSEYEQAQGWHNFRPECPQPRCPGRLDDDGECSAPTCRGGR